MSGWYCNECSGERSYQRDLLNRLCDSKERNHWYYQCPDCKAIQAKRKCEAAQRGALTRKKNYPHWVRPSSADMFWANHAHSMVANAIRHGLIPKLDGTIACADCGGVATEYDHRDYSRPLDVEPCCKPCNRRRGTAKWPNSADYDFPRIPQAISA